MEFTENNRNLYPHIPYQKIGDTPKRNDLFRNVDEFGSDVLKVLEEYEEQRSSQEPKVLAKLDNACSMLDRQTKETQHHKTSSNNS